MPNRREVEEVLCATEKFSVTFERAAVGLAHLALDGKFLMVNERFCEIVGLSRLEVLTRTFPDVIDSDLAGDEERRGAHPRATCTKARRLLRRDGRIVWIHCAVSPVCQSDNDEPRYFVAVVEDVTERHEAEQALRESEQRFRELADSITDPFFAFDRSLRCTYWNRAAEFLTGIPSAQSIGKTLDQVVGRDEARQATDVFVKVLESRQPCTLTCPYRNDGKDLVFEVRVYPTGTGVSAFARDITERALAEQVLRESEEQITGLLITAQEEERCRIARELHDNIGQQLALLAVQVQKSKSTAPGNVTERNAQIDELYKRTKDIGSKVSQLSHQLHSSELELLGLPVAVEAFCREFSKQYNIEIGCICREVPKALDSKVALCFHRILQEALHNVAKHSHANAVQVELLGSPDELVLVVRDNGAGFDAGSPRSKAGLGMISMRERAHLSGGDFTIRSKPGEGTQIKARAPLKRPSP